MGAISTFVFTSDSETVTKTKLNNLVANLKTEFNGSVDNDNIKANAGIVGSKLDLSAPGAIGGTTPAAGTFTDIVSTGGTIDGTTIGGTTPAAITGTVIKADTSLELATGATVTGIADEDNMSSDSATLISTQQSIKKYIDDAIAAVAKIKTGTYTGNGTVAQEITGVGFAPKFVKIWRHFSSVGDESTWERIDEMASNHCFLHVPSTSATEHRSRVNELTAFGADSFFVDDAGTDSDPNKDGQVYDYMVMGTS